MGRADKVVLAYSGGVDTSVCIPYLKEEWGVKEVITLAADLGQGEELGPIKEKALKSGAAESLVADAKEIFVKEYAFPAIQANTLYESRYPLSTALARPLIAKLLVEAAEKYGADAVAHGCTGKGNDQVRFDVGIMALNPNLKVLAPAREWGMSREQTIAYGERFGIEAPVKKSSPYSIDRNLLGRSIEAGPLEEPMTEPPEEIYAMTKAIADTPNEPEYVEIGFYKGIPVSINGQTLDPVTLISQLNEIVGKHGFGRIDMIENRVVGIKSLVSGRARVAHHPREIADFNPGEILVAPTTNADFVEVIRKAVGIITEEDSLTSHAAVIGLRLGIPVIVGFKGAMQSIREGAILTIDAQRGLVSSGAIAGSQVSGAALPSII